MLVKVDEDLPRDITRILREKGYDAARGVDQGMSGWDDSELWHVVCARTGSLSRRIRVSGTSGTSLPARMLAS